jgi:pyruvate formate lyase activating enzyme
MQTNPPMNAPSCATRDEPTALIWDIKQYALHDGPGIRTTVFFKGCPLRCAWCCNPESQSFVPEVTWIAENCIGCRQCVQLCPQQAIEVVSEALCIDADRCDGCGRCADNCPGGALQTMGKVYTIDRLMEEVLKDEGFFWRSGGGLTLSGGEPLARVGFARRLLKRYKQETHGHTAVETCGQADPEAVAALLPLVDLWLFDLKHIDPAAHRRGTGADNRRILENARTICEAGAALIPRIPLIPGFNDDRPSLVALATFAAALPGVNEVHLMPYHRLGQSKYTRLNRPYPLGDRRPPTPAAIETARRIFADAGLKTGIGG